MIIKLITVVAVAIVLAIIAVVTAIILVIKRRKKIVYYHSTISLSNMMYESNATALSSDSNGRITNMVYNAVHPINGEALGLLTKVQRNTTR